MRPTAQAAPRAGASAEPIPLVDLRASYERHRAELDDAVRWVLADSSFIGGAEHEKFAEEFAAWCGGGHVALVGNGTDALTFAILETLGPGDGRSEIITTSHTFIATAEAIANAGYRPVFAEIDAATCLLSPEAVERAITPRSRAVIPVHLYGQMIDVARFHAITERHGLKLIEDAAQAHGARFGGMRPGEQSAAACFSFYPGKNLGAWGDGGAVFTKDADLAARIARRANHGRRDKYVHETVGSNSRLDTLQAAILRVKLRHLDAWNAARRDVASLYDGLLKGQEGIRKVTSAAGAHHVYHLYVVQVEDRDRVRSALAAAGIGAGVHYPLPLHEQPAFAYLGYAADALPATSRAAKRVLSLPIYPEITPAQIERVASALVAAVKA
jgi:dTDP-4-amino-4,6-dideoxygalactose transaminase